MLASNQHSSLSLRNVSLAKKDRVGRIVVEQLSHHAKVKGLGLATATGAWRLNLARKNKLYQHFSVKLIIKILILSYRNSKLQPNIVYYIIEELLTQ